VGYRLSATTMAGELLFPPPYTGSYSLDQEDVSAGAEQVGGVTGVVLRMRAPSGTDGAALSSVTFDVGGVTLAATGTTQPTVVAAGVNGKPAIRFDGTDDVMSGGVLIAQTQPYTVAIFYRPDTAATNRNVTYLPGVEILNWTSHAPMLWCGAGVQAATSISSTAGGWVIGVANGTSSAVYANGDTGVTGDAGGGGIGASDTLYLGNHPSSGGRAFGGDIYELVVFDHALTSGEQTSLNTYFTQTYTASAVTGDASLTATATVGTAGFVTELVGASLAATATTVAAGAVTRVADASLAGTASVTTAGVPTAVAGTSLDATATITAVGRVVSDWSAPVDGTTQGGALLGQASLAATATVAAAGFVTAASAASLTGVSTVAAAGFAVRPSGASVTATATVSSAATVTEVTGASLTGAASITAAGFLAVASGAAVAGTATITAVGAALGANGAVLTVTAAVTAAGVVSAVGAATVSAAATITAVGLVVRPTGASVATTASITAAGFLSLASGAALANTATVTTVGTIGAVAAVSSTATITTAGLPTRVSAASLTATASITTTGLVIAVAVASLTGSASISTTARVLAFAGAALAVQAQIVAVGLLIPQVTLGAITPANRPFRTMTPAQRAGPGMASVRRDTAVMGGAPRA
jgi:hypothetical protein